MKGSAESVGAELTDSQIINAAYALDAVTRVSEMRPSGWHASTIFDGDEALFAFVRSLCARPSAAGRASEHAWPFQRSPGAVANSLNEALAEFGDMLPAVRNVFIENAEPLYRAEPAMEPVALPAVIVEYVNAANAVLDALPQRFFGEAGVRRLVEKMNAASERLRAWYDAAPVLAALPDDRADSVSQQDEQALYVRGGISSERAEPRWGLTHDQVTALWARVDADKAGRADGGERETSAAPCPIHPMRWQPCPICGDFSRAHANQQPAPSPDDLVRRLRSPDSSLPYGDHRGDLAREAAEAIEARDRTIKELARSGMNANIKSTEFANACLKRAERAEADAARKEKALAELVACKDLHKARHAAINRDEWLAIDEEYERRMPLAWAAARAALNPGTGEAAR